MRTNGKDRNVPHAQVLRKHGDKYIRHAHARRKLLLHLPLPSDPITPSQVWWSVPTLALKSPRDELVCTGCCRNKTVQIIVELVFDFILVGHRRCIGTDGGCMFIVR